MCAFLEEVYFLGVSSRQKSLPMTACPYGWSSENGTAWLLGWQNGKKLPSYAEAKEDGLNNDIVRNESGNAS